MIKNVFRTAILIAAFGASTTVTRAQMLTVARETFETQTAGSTFGTPVGGTTATIIVAGGTAPTAPQALQVSGSIASGFGVEGSNFNPTIQPAANGSPNTSAQLANYTLSLDLAFQPGTGAIPGFEVQLFNNNNANQGLLLSLDTTGMLADGVYRHFTMTLNNNSGQPFGTTVLLDPRTQSYNVIVDAVQGGFAATTPVIFRIDNFAITTVPEPTTYAMLLLGVGGALLMWHRRRAAIV